MVWAAVPAGQAMGGGLVALRRAFQWSGRARPLEDSMIDVERNSRFLAAVAIAIAVITATYIGASRWESVRNKPKERSLKVTGSAKKRILSDLAEWSATITVVDQDRT